MQHAKNAGEGTLQFKCQEKQKVNQAKQETKTLYASERCFLFLFFFIDEERTNLEF